MYKRQVLQTAVGAAADHNLIDLDVLALAGKVGVLGQVGVADGRLKGREVDFNGLLVLGDVYKRQAMAYPSSSTITSRSL